MKNKNKKDKPTPTAVIITDEAKDNVFVDCNINGLKIEKKAEGNKFIATDITATSEPPKKKFYEKPTGILILGAIASLLAWLILHLFGLA